MNRRCVLRHCVAGAIAGSFHHASGRLIEAERPNERKPGGAPGSARPEGTTWRVGSSPGALARIADAAARAQDGDVVEIEAGEYRGDVAVWSQRRLGIRAVGGRVRLIADGNAAEEKAIWVIRDGVFDIEGIEFSGARVPHNNGAGIRFERGLLTVRDCRFLRNEMGLLTNNDPGAELRVESCEFADNGYGVGNTHQLYVGRIARLSVSASWFHRGHTGHLLKTRARDSRILCNRLTDEIEGQSSYELEFPDGGLALVMGNLLEQQDTTQNATIVSYGAEGHPWAENVLAFAHNTLVNRRQAGATFVRVFPGPSHALLWNNVFVGPGSFAGVDASRAAGNLRATLSDLRDADAFDYRLARRASARRQAIAVQALGPWDATNLQPVAEYLHPMSLRRLAASRGRTQPGALQG